MRLPPLNGRKNGPVAVIGSSAAMFWSGALLFGYPGVMATHWQRMFGVGQGATGNCLLFVVAALGIFTFLVGRWQERAGIRTMIAAGSVLSGLALLIAAYATHLHMIYLWSFLSGIAVALVYIPALTTVQCWFPERRGLFTGIVNLVFGLAGAVMPPVFSSLLGSMGYLHMNLLISLLATGTGITAALFTDPPQPEQQRPEENTGQGGYRVKTAGQSLTVRQCLRTRSFWFLWVVWALQGSAGINMVAHLVEFGLSKGFLFQEAVLVLTSFNLMNGLSRIISGYVSDAAGRNITMSISFFAAGAAYFALPFAQDIVLVASIAGVTGFAFGTLFAVSAPLVTDCYGIKHFGAIFGLAFTGYGLMAGFLGPSLSGYIVDANGGNYLPVFAYLGLFSALSGVLIRLVTPPDLQAEPEEPSSPLPPAGPGRKQAGKSWGQV